MPSKNTLVRVIDGNQYFIPIDLEKEIFIYEL